MPLKELPLAPPDLYLSSDLLYPHEGGRCPESACWAAPLESVHDPRGVGCGGGLTSVSLLGEKEHLSFPSQTQNLARD